MIILNTARPGKSSKKCETEPVKADSVSVRRGGGGRKEGYLGYLGREGGRYTDALSRSGTTHERPFAPRSPPQGVEKGRRKYVVEVLGR